MLPIIIIILSSLVLLFSILRKKAIKDKNTFESHLSVYFSLPGNSTTQTKIKTLLDAAIKNLNERKEIFEQNQTVKQLSNKRLLSMKQLDILVANSKELDYEQLVIQSEAENLKPNWDIFNEAAKLLPAHKKREEKEEKDTIQKENTFFIRKKKTLELSLINKIKAE